MKKEFASPSKPSAKQQPEAYNPFGMDLQLPQFNPPHVIPDSSSDELPAGVKAVKPPKSTKGQPSKPKRS